MFLPDPSDINDQLSIVNNALPSPALSSQVNSNGLNTALSSVQSQLQKFFASSNALEHLGQVFDITDQNTAELLIKNGALGNFANLPNFQVLSDTAMNGAQAGFADSKNTIYLSESLAQGDVLKIQEALIEELAHQFDTLLNPGGDTAGDEGELFKHVVFALPLSEQELLRIQTEDDSGTVVVDNEIISIEQSYNSLIRSSPGFTKNRGGWTDNNNYPRVSGDVNGDGRADIIGFGSSNVFVSLSNGNGTFGSPIASTPTAGFTKNRGGWIDNNNYPRVSGDVNGDGRDDIVGFGATNVFVSLSNGNGTFGSSIASTPTAGFTKNRGGWIDNNNYPRILADVNGDGRDDIVGFGSSKVFVSLSNGNGTFGTSIASSPGFTKNVGGWIDNNNYPRVLADVNGDGRDDIVGFGAASVFVSLSNGNGTFASPIGYKPGLTKNVGGWTDNNNYPRIVGDINQDGADDLIGFGGSDVFVSLSEASILPPPPPPPPPPPILPPPLPPLSI